MKKSGKKCPSCGSLEVTTLHTLFYWWCCSCGYGWDRQAKDYPSKYNPHYIAQAELKEHRQYLKDGIKLTEQDKLDLQIDLWLYGKR